MQNFGVLQPLQQQAQPLMGQAPPLPQMGSQAPDSGMDDLFKGAGTLAKALSKSSGEQPAEAATPLPESPGSANVGNTYGMNQSEQTANPNAANQPLGVAGSNSENLFDLAKQYLGKNEHKDAPLLMTVFGKMNAIDPQSQPWCTAFVNGILQKGGVSGSGSQMARSLLKWGEDTTNPSVGDVVVLARKGDSTNTLGHAGFFGGWNPDGSFKMISGNHNDAVGVGDYNKDQVLGFRRVPTGKQVQEAYNNNPEIQQTLNEQGSTMAALPIIKEFEGFSSKPYWDVNAYRAGYGSDTTTTSDGKILKIKPGMSVSKEDSERDLTRRTKEFENTAMNQVGAKVWNSLPENARVALTSVAYNYGSLPKSVVPATQSGDINNIADAVRGLGGDNKGVNKSRRNKEADLILKGDENQRSSSSIRESQSPTNIPNLLLQDQQQPSGIPNLSPQNIPEPENIPALRLTNSAPQAGSPLGVLANSKNYLIPPNIPMFNGQKPLMEMTPQEIQTLMKFNQGNLNKLVG